jgi:hypothetical protein
MGAAREDYAPVGFDSLKAMYGIQFLMCWSLFTTAKSQRADQSLSGLDAVKRDRF